MKSRFLQLIQAADDVFNPIVIKELRQAVQGRFLVGILMLFFLVQMGTLGIMLLTSNLDLNSASGGSFHAGRDYFMVLITILLGTCIFFVPLYAGIRFASERSNQKSDLLFITTLSPASIISGKFFSALLLVVFLYSAALPFLAVSYLLRGIDFPSIFISLAAAFLIIAAIVQLSILVASLPAPRFFKVLIGIVGLGCLGFVFSMAIAGTYQLLHSGIGSYVSSWSFWGPALLCLLIAVAVIGQLFTLSITVLTPATANRALIPRIFLFALWIVSIVTSIIISIVNNSYIPLFIFTAVFCFLLSCSLLIVINERDKLSYRVARTIPKNPLKRLLFFPFYSGVASGLVWNVFLIALTLLIPFAIYVSVGSRWAESSDMGKLLLHAFGTVLFVYAYATSGLLLRKSIFRRIVHPLLTWLLALGVFLFAIIVPVLLVFLFNMWHQVQEGALLATPFVLDTSRYRDTAVLIACAWSATCSFLLLPLIFKHYKRFKPPAGPPSSDGVTRTIPGADLANTAPKARVMFPSAASTEGDETPASESQDAAEDASDAAEDQSADPSPTPNEEVSAASVAEGDESPSASSNKADTEGDNSSDASAEGDNSSDASAEVVNSSDASVERAEPDASADAQSAENETSADISDASDSSEGEEEKEASVSSESKKDKT